MAARRVERLLNLVIALLSTRHVLTVEQIHEIIPDYRESGRVTDEAFRRTFERDKAELRDLGIPLETALADPLDENSVGYRIARRDYELPDVHLEPDEAAAVGLAARLWRSPDLAGTTRAALHKLQAAGADVDPSVPGVLEPVQQADAVVVQCWSAVSEGRPVTFAHRPAGGGPPTVRRVEPWGVVTWRGRWYLVGHDRDRGAPRSFRLSRVEGDVRPDGEPGTVVPPADVDLLAHVTALAEDGRGENRAVLALRPGRGFALRQRATTVEPGAAPDGDDLVTLRFSDAARLAEQVAGLGDVAVVLEPPELRAAVVDLLRRTARAHTAPSGASGPGTATRTAT